MQGMCGVMQYQARPALRATRSMRRVHLVLSVAPTVQRRVTTQTACFLVPPIHPNLATLSADPFMPTQVAALMLSLHLFGLRLGPLWETISGNLLDGLPLLS